jgi:hypothetical protein
MLRYGIFSDVMEQASQECVALWTDPDPAKKLLVHTRFLLKAAKSGD